MRGSKPRRRSNFNPPAPCGAGRGHRTQLGFHPNFNPPAPCGAGQRCAASAWRGANFNPPAPCGAGHVWMLTLVVLLIISIHPPRAGRDPCRPSCPCHPGYFNPPAPCGAGQAQSHWFEASKAQFQSTRPVRGGTIDISAKCCAFIFQSTRPVRGGTKCGQVPALKCSPFQSTRPVRGGTRYARYVASCFWISIHPPRAGRDRHGLTVPPSPEGISIHPPRAGRDPQRPGYRAPTTYFNPPAPCGAGRTRVRR